jgi:hypothetical protein
MVDHLLPQSRRTVMGSAWHRRHRKPMMVFAPQDLYWASVEQTVDLSAFLAMSEVVHILLKQEHPLSRESQTKR